MAAEGGALWRAALRIPDGPRSVVVVVAVVTAAASVSDGSGDDESVSVFMDSRASDRALRFVFGLIPLKALRLPPEEGESLGSVFGVVENSVPLSLANASFG